MTQAEQTEERMVQGIYYWPPSLKDRVEAQLGRKESLSLVIRELLESWVECREGAR